MADEETVKLISADGHQFVVDRKAALVSGTIKSMLSGPGMSPGDFKSLYILHVFTLSLHRYIHGAGIGRNKLPGDLHPHPGESHPVLLLQTTLHE